MEGFLPRNLGCGLGRTREWRAVTELRAGAGDALQVDAGKDACAGGRDQGIEDVDLIVAEEAAAFEQGAKQGVGQVAHSAGDEKDQEGVAVGQDCVAGRQEGVVV
jgi:hypothetical protein